MKDFKGESQGWRGCLLIIAFPLAVLIAVPAMIIMLVRMIVELFTWKGRFCRKLPQRIETARNGTDLTARREAIGELGYCGQSVELETLFYCLDDTDESVRSAAATSFVHVYHNAPKLRPILNQRAIPELTARLRDEGEWVRRNAAETLGNLRDNRAIEPLLVALEDEAAVVRQQAVAALGTLGSIFADDLLTQRKPNPPFDQATSDRLAGQVVTRLQDADTEVRYAAIQTLRQLGSRTAATPLLAAMNADRATQQKVAEALVELGDASATPALIAILERELDPQGFASLPEGDNYAFGMDYTLVETLAAVGDKRAIPILRRVSAQDEGYERMQTSDGLFTIGELATKAIQRIEKRG